MNEPDIQPDAMPNGAATAPIIQRDIKPPKRRRAKSKRSPTHYKVICISMYTADIEALDVKVAELKRRGCTRANKSQLIRLALDELDLDRAMERLQGAR